MPTKTFVKVQVLWIIFIFMFLMEIRHIDQEFITIDLDLEHMAFFKKKNIKKSFI